MLSKPKPNPNFRHTCVQSAVSNVQCPVSCAVSSALRPTVATAVARGRVSSRAAKQNFAMWLQVFRLRPHCDNNLPAREEKRKGEQCLINIFLSCQSNLFWSPAGQLQLQMESIIYWLCERSSGTARNNNKISAATKTNCAPEMANGSLLIGNFNCAVWKYATYFAVAGAADVGAANSSAHMLTAVNYKTVKSKRCHESTSQRKRTNEAGKQTARAHTHAH